MSTKLKGDIAEQKVIVKCMEQEWNVLVPVGDRLPYDLALDISGWNLRIQVKMAWFYEETGNYKVDVRKSNTNRTNCFHSRYDSDDFDFAVIVLPDSDVMYIFPADIFLSYKSTIDLVECERRQRKPRSANYRNAWHLISEWAHCVETHGCKPVKFGEAGDVVIPSQASDEEGVET